MSDNSELLAQLGDRHKSIARYCEDQYRADKARRKELAEEKPDGLPLCDPDHKWETSRPKYADNLAFNPAGNIIVVDLNKPWEFREGQQIRKMRRRVTDNA